MKYIQEYTSKKWWKKAGQVVLQSRKDYLMAHFIALIFLVNWKIDQN